jgi:hypothetical protein
MAFEIEQPINAGPSLVVELTKPRPLSLRWDKDYLTTVVAVLGTTISPYLFFWQASQEAEDVRTDPARQILKRAPHQGERALNRIHLDTFVGMAFSNFSALAIMITAAATLHANVTDIQTSAQAAEALRAHCRASCRDDICPWRHRHRHVVRPRPRRIGGIRRRQSAEVADRARSPADGSQDLLRSHLHRDDRRHDHEFHSDRSDTGLVLECCDQWRGRRSSHGDHDVAGRRAQGHGRVRRFRRVKALGWTATAVMALAVAAMIATYNANRSLENLNAWSRPRCLPPASGNRAMGRRCCRP